MCEVLIRGEPQKYFLTPAMPSTLRANRVVLYYVGGDVCEGDTNWYSCSIVVMSYLMQFLEKREKQPFQCSLVPGTRSQFATTLWRLLFVVQGARGLFPRAARATFVGLTQSCSTRGVEWG